MVASFAQGAIFLTPAGGGPMYGTDRPLRHIEERDRPATIPHTEALQRVAHHAPDQKRVVIAAPVDGNAYDMLRLVNDVDRSRA